MWTEFQLYAATTVLTIWMMHHFDKLPLLRAPGQKYRNSRHHTSRKIYIWGTGKNAYIRLLGGGLTVAFMFMIATNESSDSREMLNSSRALSWHFWNIVFTCENNISEMPQECFFIKEPQQKAPARVCFFGFSCLLWNPLFYWGSRPALQPHWREFHFQRSPYSQKRREGVWERGRGTPTARVLEAAPYIFVYFRRIVNSMVSWWGSP